MERILKALRVKFPSRTADQPLSTHDRVFKECQEGGLNKAMELATLIQNSVSREQLALARDGKLFQKFTIPKEVYSRWGAHVHKNTWKHRTGDLTAVLQQVGTKSCQNNFLSYIEAVAAMKANCRHIIVNEDETQYKNLNQRLVGSLKEDFEEAAIIAAANMIKAIQNRGITLNFFFF
jgi:hypothetical protein